MLLPRVSGSGDLYSPRASGSDVPKASGSDVLGLEMDAEPQARMISIWNCMLSLGTLCKGPGTSSQTNSPWALNP